MVTVPAWTTPPTKSSGDTVTAADWQAAVENVRFLNAPPACVVRRSASQTIVNGAWTTVTFDEVDYYDPYGFHNPASNPSRLTVPTGCAGVYVLAGTFVWGALPGTFAGCRFLANGGTLVGENAATNQAAAGAASTHWSLAVGDYIEMQVFQNSGGPISLFGGGADVTLFSAVWLGATS